MNTPWGEFVRSIDNPSNEARAKRWACARTQAGNGRHTSATSLSALRDLGAARLCRGSSRTVVIRALSGQAAGYADWRSFRVPGLRRDLGLLRKLRIKPLRASPSFLAQKLARTFKLRLGAFPNGFNSATKERTAASPPRLNPSTGTLVARLHYRPQQPALKTS